MLIERRLERQLARRIARLPDIRLGVDMIRDTIRPAGDVVGLGFAPVVAARGVGVDGTAAGAAGAFHFFDEGVVGYGDGAEEVGGFLVGAGEVGDVGSGADGVGDTADWEGGDVSFWVVFEVFWGFGGLAETYFGRFGVGSTWFVACVCVCDSFQRSVLVMC